MRSISSISSISSLSDAESAVRAVHAWNELLPHDSHAVFGMLAGCSEVPPRGTYCPRLQDVISEPACLALQYIVIQQGTLVMWPLLRSPQAVVFVVVLLQQKR